MKRSVELLYSVNLPWRLILPTPPGYQRTIWQPIQPGFMIGGKKLRQVIRRISWRNPPNKVYYEHARSSSVSSGFLDEMDLFSVTEPEVSRSSSPSSSGPLSGQITDTALDASTSFTPSPIPPNLTLPHLPYEILDYIIRDTPEYWI